ncbi:MAG: CopG family ribbon-helix-helix protein [Beijerinckiaceae bacterium]
MESTALTVRLPPEVKARLGKLAQLMQRTKSFLAGEAIADFVAREHAIVEAIERGMKDAKAGRVSPHDDVVRETKAILKAAK